MVTAYNLAVAVTALAALLRSSAAFGRAARRRARALPRRLDRVRLGAEPRVPDRGAECPGRRRGAAAGGSAAGARARAVDGGGDLRACARTRARRRPDPGVRLAGDLRRPGAGRRARTARRLARSRQVEAEEGWSPSLKRTLPANACLGLVFGALVGALFLAVLLVISVWDYSPIAGAGIVSALPLAALPVRPLRLGPLRGLRRRGAAGHRAGRARVAALGQRRLHDLVARVLRRAASAWRCRCSRTRRSTRARG